MARSSIFIKKTCGLTHSNKPSTTLNESTAFAMKTSTVIVKLPRVKRRAIELYHADSPFKPKRIGDKRAFKRHNKHRSKDFE